MRIRAFLLLALFLGAGTSLPSLDAMLYHRHGAERHAGDTHLDPPGGCGGHADHCTLGRTPPGSRSVQPWTVEVRITPGRAVPAFPAPVSHIIVLSLRVFPQPRAPPAQTA